MRLTFTNKAIKKKVQDVHVSIYYFTLICVLMVLNLISNLKKNNNQEVQDISVLNYYLCSNLYMCILFVFQL